MGFARISGPKRLLMPITVSLLAAVGSNSAQFPQAQTVESGFRLLYELEFEKARSTFQAWEKDHPQDPLGPAAEAASYLFQEFYKHGVLTSEFFLDNKRLLDGIEGKPDPDLRKAFQDSIARAQDIATQGLKTNPKDTDALYVLTITTGMQGNYAGVLEKHHLQSLKYTQKAESYAKKLLALKPDSQDAYVALGASNYIIGCLPAYKKFALFFGGIHGDKQEGIRQLTMAAAHGHYLQPFAKILLALAALRERRTALAKTQLEELTAEFPHNPLFARELSLLNKPTKQVSGDPSSRVGTQVNSIPGM